MLRKCMVAVVLGLAVTVPATAQGVNTSGRVVAVRPTMDVVRGGQKGMLIELDSELDGLQNRVVCIRAVFYVPNGQPLLAGKGAIHRSPDGFVSTWVNVTPPFLQTNQKNTQLFMPYDELTLGIPGVLPLRFVAEVSYRGEAGWVILDRTAPVSFKVIQE
jgi:hypothetical protein